MILAPNNINYTTRQNIYAPKYNTLNISINFLYKANIFRD